LAPPEVSTLGFAHFLVVLPGAAEAIVGMAAGTHDGAVGRVGFPFKAVQVFAPDLFVDGLRFSLLPAYLDEVLAVGSVDRKLSFHKVLDGSGMALEDFDLLWAKDFKAGLDGEGHGQKRAWATG
jgi:hypothetical protein